ncbi:MAG: PilN domain-containing protein [Steroidobacteraceae bacterium]|nr:PilN domain-containing protein [Steroidobacteraceae bacterium]
MPQINLLPWRAEQRKERKLAFLVALGGGTFAAMLATFVIYLMFSSLISGQQQRNEKLKGEIATLDKQIEEINNLEAQKQRFISRMEIIEKLQRSRPEIVHVFDELVRTLPDGTFLTGVKQTDRRLKLDGVAQSSTRVSTFMRNIDKSQWLRNPELAVIETKKDQALGSTFTLYANQVSVAGEDDGATKPRTNRPAKKGASQ